MLIALWVNISLYINNIRYDNCLINIYLCCPWSSFFLNSCQPKSYLSATYWSIFRSPTLILSDRQLYIFKNIFYFIYATNFYHKRKLYLFLQLELYRDTSSDTSGVQHATDVYFWTNISRSITVDIQNTYSPFHINFLYFVFCIYL
jgi:hypothetical protein